MYNIYNNIIINIIINFKVVLVKGCEEWMVKGTF
jgi:hypothetical protein